MDDADDSDGRRNEKLEKDLEACNRRQRYIFYVLVVVVGVVVVAYVVAFAFLVSRLQSSASPSSSALSSSSLSSSLPGDSGKVCVTSADVKRLGGMEILPDSYVKDGDRFCFDSAWIQTTMAKVN